jgi:hypothetical protein
VHSEERRDKNSAERELEELKRLLISQIESNQEELRVRDENIEKLTILL